VEGLALPHPVDDPRRPPVVVVMKKVAPEKC
jgi:hypothetical protein